MPSIQLWDTQRRALEFLIAQPEAALLCDPRTGKTYISLALIDHLSQDSEVIGLAVVLLNNKETTWMDKARELVPHVTFYTDWGDFKAARGHRVFLVHYEAVSRIVKQLVKYRWFNLAIVDEAHRIARRGSAQSRAVGRLHRIPRKVILTGTPIEKQPQDLWAQLRFLCPSILGSWKEFEEEYLEFRSIQLGRYKPGTSGFQRAQLQARILRSKAKFNPDKLSQFIELIKPHCFRLTKGDVGIVDPTIKKVVCQVPHSLLRHYSSMEADSIVRLRSKSIMADMEAVKIAKLIQLANGFIYDEDQELHWISDYKVQFVADLAEQLAKPVVILTALKPETDAIADELADRGLAVEVLSGSTSKRLRPSILRSFQKAQYDVLVCQIRTGGVGVDLWKSNNAIVASMRHSYIDWAQGIARMDALNKNVPPTIWVVCGGGTIDEQLFDLVWDKHETGQLILKQLRKEPHDGKEPRRQAEGLDRKVEQGRRGAEGRRRR